MTVTVTDTGGLSNTTSKTVNVDALVAALSVTPSSGAAPLAVTAARVGVHGYRRHTDRDIPVRLR